MEALAAGVPVICFDHQGAGDMIDGTCGIKIPVTSPKRAYIAWAEAIQALADDPDRLFELSHGATERAEKFLWSANHARINAIYQDLVGRSRSTISDPASVIPARQLADVSEIHAS